MNKAIKNFNFQSHQLTVVMDENDNPWFIAKEVCEILELSDVTKTVERLDDDENLTRILFVSGQRREVNLINESGFYSLVLTSRKPEAKAFKKWLTSEVLPSIRKTGSYSLVNEDGEFRKNMARNRQIMVLAGKISSSRNQFEADIYADQLQKLHEQNGSTMPDLSLLKKQCSFFDAD